MVCRKTQISEDFFKRPNAGKVFDDGTTKAARFRESGQRRRQNPSKSKFEVLLKMKSSNSCN